MPTTKEHLHRTPEVRFGLALVVTGLLVGIVWWSQVEPPPCHDGGCHRLHGTWYWTDDDVPGQDVRLGEHDWEAVEFPGRQFVRALRAGRLRWYRHRFDLPAGFATTDRVLLLGPVHADHEVWINNRRIGGAGSLDGTGDIVFSQTRLYPIPPEVLVPGDTNLLALRVRNRLPSRIGPRGRMLAIGPLEHLTIWADATDRGQVLFSVMLIALGLFFLMLAYRSRDESYFWALALGTVALGVNGMIRGGWLGVPGMSETSLSILNDFIILLPGPFLFFFICHAVLRPHVPRPIMLFSRWFFAYPVILAVPLAVGGAVASNVIDSYVNDPAMLALALLGTILALRGALRGDRHARVMTAAIVVFCATVVFEILIGQLRLGLPRFFHSAGMLQLVLAMAVIVSQRLASVQRETERINRRLQAFNQELEQRVTERTGALAATNAELDQRNREQRELLHVLCHDLANPVGAVVGAVELLESDRSHLDKLLPLLQLAGSNATATIDFVRRLRSLEERPLSLYPVELADAVQDSVDLLGPRCRAKRLAVEVDVPDGLVVSTEPTALVNSVLANLLTNAIKFTPAGGHIAISARDEAGTVELCVADTGIGIPPEILDVIFDLGAPTTRPGTEGETGTGYGLPMVHRFMTLFGGEVKIDTREGGGPDGGTRVTLVFRRGSAADG